MFNFSNLVSAANTLDMNPTKSPSHSEPPSTPNVLLSSPFANSEYNQQSSRNIETSRTASPNVRVELSCLSPDHRSFHTLHNNDTIITQSLPLKDDFDSNSNQPSQKKSNFRSIRTKLPSYITQILQIDEPLELVCVDNDTPTNFLLPLLCIYTAKSVFVIQIQYEKYSAIDNSLPSAPFRGEVISVHEPFESYLLSREDVRICRIRSAPQSSQHKLYSTICNRGAMVMLCTQEIDTFYESNIVLFHGWSNKSSILKNENGVKDYYITTPSTLHSEETDSTPIVDMAFAPSVISGLADDTDDGSFWSSTSLLLTTENGSIYMLNPIVFDNTFYPKRFVWNAFNSLQLEIMRSENLASKVSECKRSKAAFQYLKSVFDLEDTFQIGSLEAFERSGYYIQTKVKHGRHATSWPVALQGPIYASYTDDDNFDSVECLELIPPFSEQTVEGANGTSILAIALGRKSCVDYIIIPSAASTLDGTHILNPRFEFEDEEDSAHLNNLIRESGILVERLIIEEDNLEDDSDFIGGIGKERVSILIDPFMEQTMLHHISPLGVVSITTNAVSLILKKLSKLTEGVDDIESEKVKTSAFSTIEISDSIRISNPLNGVIISGDSLFGHVMVVVLSDGSMEAVNMTAVIYLNEDNSQSSLSNVKNVSSKKSISNQSFRDINTAIQAFSTIPSLEEQISPLCEQITSGLANMNKIVGGSTKPQNITPGMVAALLTTKQSSEQDVILPLKQIHAIVAARIPFLETMRKQQLSQIGQLKEIVDKMQERTASTTKKRQLAENNSKVLAARVSALLSTVRDLTPNLTQAEQDYFKDVDRHAVNVAKWDQSLQEAKDRYRILQDKTILSDMILTDTDKDTCNDLLFGEEEVLDSVSTRIERMENMVNRILSVKRILSVANGTV